MKNKKSLILLISCTTLFYSLQTTEQIDQDATNSDFQQNISVKAFDRYDGTLYVGTEANNNNYSIAKAGRTDTVFTGLSISSGAQGKIDYMALCNVGGKGTTHIPFNLDGSNELRFIKLSDKSTPDTMIKPLGNAASGNICDAGGGVANSYTNLTGGSTADGSKTYVFLRVNGHGAINKGNSGILAYEVKNDDTLTKIGTSATNNPAAKLDNKKGQSTGDGNFLRYESASTQLNTPPNVTDMHWDQQLETLFVSGHVVTNNVNNNNYNIGISKLKISTANNLEISDILPNNVNPQTNNISTIFCSRTNNQQIDIAIHKIRTMHTSTGKTYLITHGATNDNAGYKSNNKFYALRYNPTTGHVVSNNTTGTELVNQFTLHTDTVANKSLDGLNTNSLTIGGKDAPWAENTANASDMEVIGDTVYVSFNGINRNVDNDPGIWSSQALFDNNGVIIGWTKWERVFRSENDNNKDKAKFFAVDATNAKLWQINNDTTDNPKVIRRMQWLTSSFGENSLPTTLNNSLSNGCTSVLDLPKGIPGLTSATANSESICMFGGIDKIIFARTKSNNNAVTTDFNKAIDYKETTLSGAGVIRCLGYSRNNENATRGYFLAGTDNGLYVFASPTKTGFNGNQGLSTLDAAPFNTFTWQRLGENMITGGISAIESDGLFIYIIEQDTTSINSITSKLWKIKIKNNIPEMESDVNTKIIAKSEKGSLPENSIFTGFKLITDKIGTLGQTRGILCTNSGIYKSANIVAATDLTKNWDTIDNTNAYYELFAPKRIPTTAAPDVNGAGHKVIGIAFADDGTKFYQKSKFLQFNSNDAMAATTTLANADYTNKDMATGTNALAYLDRSLYFYSDGGRRLYSRFTPTEANYSSLQLLPYSAKEWNMTSPTKISDLSGVTRIHWIENISGLGIILCGTDTGVVALQ